MCSVPLQPRSLHPLPLPYCRVCDGRGVTFQPAEYVWGIELAGAVVLSICRSCLGSGAPREVIDRTIEEHDENTWYWRLPPMAEGRTRWLK